MKPLKHPILHLKPYLNARLKIVANTLLNTQMYLSEYLSNTPLSEQK